MATTIDSLQIQITTDIKNAENGLRRLENSLGALRAVAKGGVGLTAVSNQLRNLSSAIDTLRSPGTKISELVTSLKPLETLGKSTLNATINALNKLPDVAAKLEAMNMDRFTTSIRGLVDALKPLASELSAITTGFTRTIPAMQRFVQEATALANSPAARRMSGGFTAFGGRGFNLANIWAGVQGLKAVTNVLADCLTESNAYIENMNLFTVSMGKYAREAVAYANRVQQALGINASEWMRNQGIFMQIGSGFGVLQEKAAKMSQGLTQVAYDIASYFNIDIASALEKVQAGFAGELEPLRRLGYALDVGTLQMIAYNHGIKEKIVNMSQAQKSLLRYTAITEQSTNVMGDMARTLITPANSLRILGQQIDIAKRHIGDMISVIVVRMIPYIQVLVRVIAEAASALAKLFGFELPVLDYSGLDGAAGGASDLDDGLGGAASSAAELRKQLMGFDELNIITAPPTGGGGGSGGGSSTDLPIDPSIYDFILGSISAKVDEINAKLQPMIEWVKEHLDFVFTTVGAIGAGLLAWKIANDVTSVLAGLADGSFNKVALGITLMITGFALELAGSIAIGKGDADIWDYIQATVGALMGIGGSLLLFGTGPLGWAIGIGLAVAVLIAGITIGATEQAKAEDLQKRFGDYVLTNDELKTWVYNITHTELGVSVDLYVEEVSTRDALEDRVQSAFDTLGDLNFKLECGLTIPQEAYTRAVDELVASTAEYMQQKQVTAAMAVDILLDGTEVGTDLENFVNTYYTSSQTQLDELGKRLKEVVSTGFVDGAWIPDKLAEAQRLQGEIQEVLNHQSEIEFKAKLASLQLDSTGAGVQLTAESFTTLMTQAQEAVTKRLKDLEGVRLETLQIAQMQFDNASVADKASGAAQQVFDEAKAEIQRQFLASQLTVSAGAFNFDTDSLKKAFKDAFDAVTPAVATTMGDYVGEMIEQGLIETPDQYYRVGLETIVNDMANYYSMQLENSGIDAATKANVTELLKAMQPTAEQYEETVSEALALGQAVPKNVADGLNDYNQLKAITGNTEAISYMVGKSLSTDPAFMSMLSTAKDAGKKIDSETAAGLTANLQLVKDKATGVVTGIKNSVTGEVTKVTPTLLQNLKDLGFNISDALYKGASGKVTDDRTKFGDMWDKVPAEFRARMQINSPSRLFKGYGENLGQGLYNGMDSKIGLIKGVWDSLPGFFKTTFTTGYTNATDAFKNAKTWADGRLWNIKQGFSGVGSWFSTTFSGGYTKMGDAFKNAKTWGEGRWWNIRQGFSGVGSWFSETFRGGYTKVTNAFTNTKTWATNRWGDVKSGFSGVGTWFKTKFDEGWTKIKEAFSSSSIGKFFEGVWDTIKSKFTNIGTSIGSAVGGAFKTTMNGVFSTVENVVNGFIRKINDVIDVINSIPMLPDIGHIREISIPRMASGGFVNEGQLFIAREAGAELVGSMGGRTAVANNQQIEAGIYRAVREAMSDAGGKGNSGTLTIINQLDGEAVGRQVIKYHNGIVTQTGESPLLV